MHIRKLYHITGQFSPANYLVRFSTPDIFLLSNRFAIERVIIRVIIRVFIRRRHFGINEDK